MLKTNSSDLMPMIAISCGFLTLLSAQSFG
jgi:hypothetical protein